MLVTFKDLPKVKFPVFVLPSDDWHWTDGVLFLNGRVVDERNMPGKTLGVRRMQCRRTDLLPLRKAIFTIPDLIQCKTKYFIDVNGKPFIYMKTRRCALKCFRIKRVERKETASLLWLNSEPAPVTIPRPPVGNPTHVRALMLNGAPWLVYDYIRSPVKDTYRRV